MRESEEREALEKNRSQKRNGFLLNLDKTTTSFFITNFPEEATTAELWKVFLRYGRIGEVYIPKKRDKKGRRFGFVKFKEVAEVDALSDSLSDVWMGSFKLIVNRSRFARSDKKEERPSSPVEGSVSARKEVQSGGPYRNALLGKAGKEVLEIRASVNKEFVKELKDSMVGTLAKEKDVRRIQSILFMEGFPSVSVSHMGGNLVLIRSKVEGDVGRLIRSKNECLEYFFSEIKPWSPGLRTVQREVWIQDYGIPLHVWGDSFFKLVGSKLGVFLDFDYETASMARFDIARLKILTSSWAIVDTVIKVEVDGSSFNIWAVEERSNQRSAVVVGDGVEEEGSVAVPSEVSGEVADGYVAGVDNSGEDDSSGSENDGDVRIQIQHGEGIEKEGGGTKCV
jgi:RNA recognition motif-containing protein